MSNQVSVIITTYNRPDELKLAIKSVISQTKLPEQIIVVDDASASDNYSVIVNFDTPIIYYRFNTNQGANICRNKGVELANGEFIAFLDDDDTWKPEKLEKQLSLIQTKGTDLCYTGKVIITVDENTHEAKRRYSFAKPKYNNLKKSIMQKNFIGTTSSIMLKKEKFIEAGKFDVKMPALQDYELYIRFIHAGFSVGGIDEGLVDYFIYKETNAISKSLDKSFIASKKIVSKNFNQKYRYILIVSLLKIIFKKILKGHS